MKLRRVLPLFFLMAAAMAAVPTGAGAASLDVDRTFGQNGVAKLDLSHPSLDVARSGGDQWIAGSAGDNMGLARVVAGPSSFSSNGTVTADFGVPSAAFAVSEESGDVILAGSAGDDFAVARFDGRDMSPTRLFGEDGQATVSFGAPAFARGIVSGSPRTAVGQAGQGSGTVVAMAKLLPSGQLDPEFGDAGRVVDDLSPGPDIAYAAASVSNSHFFVAGQAGPDVLLAHYNSDGSRDTGFAGGRTTLDLTPGTDVARIIMVDGGGRIFIAGSAGVNGFVARLTAGGALDPSFGAGGVAFADLGAPSDFNTFTTVLGHVVVGGVVHGLTGDDAVSLSLDDNGSPLPSYGNGGVVRVDLGSTADTVGGIQVTPNYDPKRPGEMTTLVVGGDGADMAMARFDVRGAPVTGGMVKVDFGGPSSFRGARTVVQPDGRVVVAGYPGLSLVRFLPDGRLDPSFRPGHPTVAELGPASVTDMVLQPDGRLLVAATRASYGFHYVYRFLPDGRLDHSFGYRGEAFVNGDHIVLQPDGKVVINGGPRLDTAGQRDPTFSWGWHRTDAVAGVPDGLKSIWLTGDHPNDGNALIHRVNSDGSHDSTYQGGWGVGWRETATSLARRPDGTLVVAGATTPDWATTNGDVVVSSTTTSPIRNEFGTAGRFVGNFADSERAPTVLAQPDGSAIVVTNGRDGDDRWFVEVMRLNRQGRLDPSFGAGGVFKTNVISTANDAALAPDGSVIVSGDQGTFRYNPGAVSPVAARAFGWNPVGELGNATTNDSTSPVTVFGDSGTKAVSAGVFHSLALHQDGTVWSWGWNGVGQLGDGTTFDRHTQVRVPGLTGIVAVSAGAYHSLALRNDGTVWAWGWNVIGQLGDGTATNRQLPAPVSGLSGVTAVSAGGFHNLALRGDGSVWAWGWNGVGQLGRGPGNYMDAYAPVPVGVTGFTSISAGTYHSLAISDRDAVWSWGWNGYGQLGRPPVEMEYPQEVPGMQGVGTVSGGGLHSLALKLDGTVWGWGSNVVGQLGDGSRVDSHNAVRVSGLTGAVAISAGAFHNLALRGGGHSVAWGWNALGQLGDGTRTDRPTPVSPGATDRVTAVSAGAYHSLISSG